MNQLKYWQLYCDLFPIITQQGSGQLPHQFGEEFVRAYEKQIAEYMRFNASDDLRAAEQANQDEIDLQTEELVDQVEHNSDW